MAAHLETEEIGSYIKYNAIFRKYFFYPLLLLIPMFFVSCSSSKPTPIIETKVAPVVAPIPAPISAVFDSEPEHIPVSSSIPNTKAVNLTPLSTYNDEWVNNKPDGASFSNAYTRLLIISKLPADGGDNSDTTILPYVKRHLFVRALAGKDFSVNLTANVTVGAFESTIPLATIGHQSNSDGEKWNRVIHHSKSNFPLFLVKADGSTSVPVIKLSVNGTKSYTSRGAAAAVQVALGIARATGQTTSVVTQLSEQSTKDKARAIDDAISKLFSSGITEEHWTDRDLRAWSTSDENQPRGVIVNFRIPSDEEDWNSPLLEVGSWTITFDYPRPSIFSDWRICSTDALPRCTIDRPSAEKKVREEINAGQVLNYKLINENQGVDTIRAFISQQDWYISAQVGLVNKDENIVKETASTMCRRITNEITGLGLNGFDASIVLWAVVHGMPLPTNIDFTTIKECNASLSTIEINRQ